MKVNNDINLGLVLDKATSCCCAAKYKYYQGQNIKTVSCESNCFKTKKYIGDSTSARHSHL